MRSRSVYGIHRTSVIVWVVTLCCIILSCKKAENDRVCGNVTYRKVYEEKNGLNDDNFFAHYLVLEGYSTKCFKNIQFIPLVKQYLRTCRLPGSVNAVYFLADDKDCGFESGELDSMRIFKNSVIGFGIDSLRITSVNFTNGDGFPKVIKIDDCDFSEW